MVKETLLVILLFLSGIVSGQSVQNTPLKHSSYDTLPFTLSSGITEKEIYDFMQVVIAEQKLHREFGLSLLPKKNLDNLEKDEEILTELLETSLKDTIGNSMGRPAFHLQVLKKGLTEKDIDLMLKQKKEFSSFFWNNSRLGFNVRENNKNWYKFTVPLFSKDKSVAIITIESLCEGLCGNGKVLIFEKEEEKWKSHVVSMWWY